MRKPSRKRWKKPARKSKSNKQSAKSSALGAWLCLLMRLQKVRPGRAVRLFWFIPEGPRTAVRQRLVGASHQAKLAPVGCNPGAPNDLLVYREEAHSQEL